MFDDRISRVSWAICFIVMLVSMWLSSGTMAPYTATSSAPYVEPFCGYLHSDLTNQYSVYLLVDGHAWDPTAQGMRRILYFFLAYPFMKGFGFELGGFIFNVILYSILYVLLAKVIAERYGEKTALWSIWLLVSYPGIAYWGGIPYCHAFIMPAAFLLYFLLEELDNAQDRLRILAISLIMGVLFLGYDLLPFFGLAGVLLLLARERYLEAAISLIACALPVALWSTALAYIWHSPVKGPQTLMYIDTIQAYWNAFHANFPVWKAWLAQVPNQIAHDFFYGNFLTYSALFVAAVGLNMSRGRMRVKFTRVEWAIMIAFLAVYLFNNLAPPTEKGWSIKGPLFTRVFESVFVAYFFYIVRTMKVEIERPKAPWLKRGWGAAVVVFMAFNMTIVFGPILRNPLAGVLYEKFYPQGEPMSFVENMDRYGYRPVGFCRPQHP